MIAEGMGYVPILCLCDRLFSLSLSGLIFKNKITIIVNRLVMNSYFCKPSSWHIIVCFRHDSGGKGGFASREKRVIAEQQRQQRTIQQQCLSEGWDRNRMSVSFSFKGHDHVGC